MLLLLVLLVLVLVPLLLLLLPLLTPCAQVFGKDRRLWLIPIYGDGPVGDGINWPTIHDVNDGEGEGLLADLSKGAFGDVEGTEEDFRNFDARIEEQAAGPYESRLAEQQQVGGPAHVQVHMVPCRYSLCKFLLFILGAHVQAGKPLDAFSAQDVGVHRV